MVETPRRSAPSDDALEPVAELGTVAAARRASRTQMSPGRIVRFAMPPLAIVSVVSLAAGLMLLPGGNAADERTDPASTHTAPIGVSRNLARPELSTSPSPSPSVSARPPSAAPSTAAPSPSATASASPTPKPASATAKPSATSASPRPDYSKLADKAETLYTTSGVNVRLGPGTSFEALTSVEEGAAVTTTERSVDGWRQVAMGKKAGWIKASLLTKEKPAAEETRAASSGSSGSSGSSDDEAAPKKGVSSASCPKAGGLEKNLTAKAAKTLRAVCGTFPEVKSYGGYRPGAGSYHGSGRAIDIMISGESGWRIANWARANADSLGVIEVIYQQKIWTTQRSGDGWRSMSDRGSVSANHYDHVHVSIEG